MVSGSERKVFGFLGEALKFLAIDDTSWDNMSQQQAMNITLETLIGKSFVREVDNTRFLQRLAEISSGEAYDRLRVKLYDQKEYLGRLANLPGVIDEFFSEKTREKKSFGYHNKFRKEIESVQQEIKAINEYLSS